MITNHTPNENLFHYCPTESFFGIANSKSIWLSNSRYANDPSENRLAYDILEDIAKDTHASSINEFAKAVLEQEFALVDDISSYVFCFSEVEDDLDHWRTYADNGYGYMLGFRPQYFLDQGLWILLTPSVVTPSIDKVYLSGCVYEYDVQRSIVERLLRAYATLEKATDLENIVRLKLQLKFFSGFFKHQSYLAESEWRAACYPVTQPQADQVHVRYPLMFRPRRRAIIQYINQQFPIDMSMKNRPIDRVVLGPNAYNDQHEIANLLQFTGLHYGKIYRSRLKLRDTF